MKTWEQYEWNRRNPHYKHNPSTSLDGIEFYYLYFGVIGFTIFLMWVLSRC